MKENTEYLELFIIVDDTKFQQGQDNIKLLPNQLVILCLPSELNHENPN